MQNTLFEKTPPMRLVAIVAVPGIISMLVSSLFQVFDGAFIPFFTGNTQLKFTAPRLSVKILKDIVANGSPSFLNSVSGRITSILMNIFLLRLGGAVAVSAYGVLMYIDGMIQPVHAISLFGFAYVTRWVSLSVQSYLSAIGKAGGATLISVSCAFIFPIILMLALAPIGLDGLWLNFPLTVLLAAVLSVILLIRMKKRA